MPTTLPPLTPMSPNHYFSRNIAPFSPSELKQARSISVRFDKVELQFLTGGGLFSRAEFDDGSRLLFETMNKHADFPDKTHFCDLGCGWGAVGALWGKTHLDHKIFALDVNPRAVQLTQLNFERNAIPNAAAWCADGLSATRDSVFDIVACNPPIRAGNATIESLFEGAYRCLKANGELWAVIRTAQGAKSWAKKLKSQFGDCQTMEMRGGFRILRAPKC
ncbi:ribosomal RNA large subunit methyltransferase G [Abditibacteriota bacterium]|nr:ribosomal RNA large subunit methyltransferase G [Abditibacteriota bacterium]